MEMCVIVVIIGARDENEKKDDGGVSEKIVLRRVM
jgi:hypothetical protein